MNTPPVHFAPGNLQLLGRAVAATTDVTALARLVSDAYQLTVTLERDMAATDAFFRFQTQLAQFEHEEIIKAMELGFQRQDRAIGVIEKITSQLIVAEQFDMAHTIVTQMITLLQSSPVKDAYSPHRP